MKKIIVFGATGNVGSYFTKYASEYFSKDEYQIIASGKRKKADVFKLWMSHTYPLTSQILLILITFRKKIYMPLFYLLLLFLPIWTAIIPKIILIRSSWEPTMCSNFAGQGM